MKRHRGAGRPGGNSSCTLISWAGAGIPREVKGLIFGGKMYSTTNLMHTNN